MSYYTFNQPIQGGGFGPSWDDEMRKRRKHSRDAGAPYQGGSSGIQTIPQRPDIGAQKAAAQELFAPVRAGPVVRAPERFGRRYGGRAGAAEGGPLQLVWTPQPARGWRAAVRSPQDDR